jgi:hypothetical protein
MKVLKRRTTAILVVAALPFLSCGDDDNPSKPGGSGITSYDQVHAWDCTISENCQDVFNIQFTAGSVVTFQATETTGGSVLQIALYGPGVTLGGTNMFTLDANEYRCNFVSGCNNNVDGQTVADFRIPASGVYRLAITRDWGNSCGGVGTYRLIINSDKTFSTPNQTVDDVASQAPDSRCPLSYDEVHDWACDTGVSCQDVFDIAFSPGSTVTFSATETTGGSVLHVALYAPGVALGGTNLFTGTTAELLCNYVSGCNSNTAGQTVSDFVIPTSGVYRLAITRDWGTSCGGSGTYRLIIDSDGPFGEPTQTVDDTATLASGTTCPI